MKRPESKDYKNKDPQIIEVLGEDLLDYHAFAVANKEYIDWLESKLKILNIDSVIKAKRTACRCGRPYSEKDLQYGMCNKCCAPTTEY